MLEVANLRIDLGHRVLLEDASFRIAEGEKVALVGHNGAGKSTMLRTLCGEMPSASGNVSRPARTTWLRQDVSASVEDSLKLAYDHLLDASPLFRVKHEMEDANARIEKAGIDLGAGIEGADEVLDRAVAKFSDLEERFRTGGGYQLESEAERIAAGVGLDDEALLRNVGELSGGQRRRLELSRMLLAGGDLLILDEPTNHLDVGAKTWVMDFLKSSRSTMLVVSHDVALMDSAIDRVISLENAQIEQYKGTWTDYLRQREEREMLRAREQSNLESEISRLEKTKSMFAKANATHAKKRTALQRRIDRVATGRVLAPVKRRKMTVRFPPPIRAGDIALEVTGLKKAFDDTVIFEDVDFLVGRGETFLVLGRNGAGKTTLLRTLAGRYEKDAGNVRLGANVTLGFYAQEHEDIRPDAPVIDLLREKGNGIPDHQLRSLLGHFGLTGQVADQPAGTLSGGEKTKLSLARLMISKANVLLLDEPTNNLDVQSVEAILAALQNYEGTIILVCHDTDFVTQLEPDKVLVLPEGDVIPFEADMLDLVGLR